MYELHMYVFMYLFFTMFAHPDLWSVEVLVDDLEDVTGCFISVSWFVMWFVYLPPYWLVLAEEMKLYNYYLLQLLSVKSAVCNFLSDTDK